MKKFWIIALASLWMITEGRSQETGENRLGSWFMVFGTNHLSEKFSLHTEAQYRTYEFGSNFNQLLLRTGLNYHFAENASVTVGYAYIPTDGTFEEISGEQNSRENRIYQQFILKNTLGKFQFTHRYRLEQRFLKLSDNRKDTQHRARYFLRVTYPLSSNWFLTAYDEIFINLQQPLFGQNRLYGALGRHISKSISLQLGYLKNHFSTAHFDRFQLGLWFTTNLKKELKER